MVWFWVSVMSPLSFIVIIAMAALFALWAVVASLHLEAK
jgi:hypothetical protein